MIGFGVAVARMYPTLDGNDESVEMSDVAFEERFEDVIKSGKRLPAAKRIDSSDASA
jgi:hypothetical protein